MPAGRVGRPHGLDGSFYVTRAVPRLLEVGATVYLAGREAEIVRRAGTAERPIVRLAGVEDRDGAEELRGAELTVQQDELPQLGEAEWWAHELAGCVVRDGDHEVVHARGPGRTPTDRSEVGQQRLQPCGHRCQPLGIVGRRLDAHEVAQHPGHLRYTLLEAVAHGLRDRATKCPRRLFRVIGRRYHNLLS